MSVASPARVGLFLGLSAAAVAVAFYVGRSQSEPPRDPPPQATTPVEDILGAKMPVKTPVQNPMELLGGSELPPPAPVFKLPELPFEERSEGLPTSGTWRGYPLLHDFTGDGRADIVVSNREEDGYNAWESPSVGPWIRRIAGLEPRNMAYGPSRAGDMNNDNIADLVLSAHTDALHVYFNDGKMNWTRSPALIENPHLMIDVAVGNLNNDPNKDVVGIAHFDGGVGVYLGDGKGGFSRLKESASLVPLDVMGRSIELVDLDGDGTDDIVTSTNAGLKAFLTRPGTPMTWEEVSRGLPVPGIGNSIYGLRVAQMLPGGWPEIVMGLLIDPGEKPEVRNGVGVYQFDSKKREWSHADSGLDRSWSYRDLAVGDMNKDGMMDIIAMTPDAGGIICLGKGDGAYEMIGRLAGVHGKCMCTVGDVDGDGWMDVLVATGAQKENPEQGSLRVFLNRAAVWKR